MSKYLKTESGKTFVIVRSIAKGKQGEVLEVQDQDTREYKAAKLFFPNKDPVKNKKEVKETKNRLRRLIAIENFEKRLVLPEDIISDDGRAGYIMELLSSDYVSVLELVNRKIKPDPEFHTVVNICINICLAFKHIHNKTMFYSDISFSNIKVNPKNGSVRVIDCDTLCMEGEESPVVGSPYFQPPELVRREVITSSKESDLWALAVLLFYILFNSHPLLGKREQAIHCYDEFAEKKLLGLEPRYIFSRTDKSNWPDSDEQKNALECFMAMPAGLKDVFNEAFTRGLDPRKRVSESKLLRELYDMKASIVRCPDCKQEVFFDKRYYNRVKSMKCWCCHTRFPVEAFLDFEGTTTGIPVIEGNNLYLAQIAGPEHGLVQGGKFVKHPKTGAIGLENTTRNSWKFTNSNGDTRTVAPRMKISMNSHNGRIQFSDNITAVIKVNTHK